MRRPTLVLTALLGLANGQIQENKLRFEAIEPLVAASSNDLTISLFGINLEQITDEIWEYDDLGYPIEQRVELKEGVQVSLKGEVDIIQCHTDEDDLGLVPIDPGFPQQAFLRSSHMLKCRTATLSATEDQKFEIVVSIPQDYGVTFDVEMAQLEPAQFGDETLDMFFEDDMLMFDESELSPVTPTMDAEIKTGLFIEIDSSYQDKQEEIERLRNTPPRQRRSTTPRITNVLPRTGSPRGGQIITIVGNNLDSDNVDIGGTTDSSVPGHGEDYFVYFERSGYSIVVCTINRMFNLLARQLGTHRSIFCETQKVPKQGTWRLKLVIDGGDPIDGGDFKFERVHAPTIDHIFHAASAPATRADETFRQRSWWSEWSDYDQNGGDDWEELYFHRHNKNCLNPIAMEAWDKATNTTYRGSQDFSGDGLASPEMWDLYRGFRCTQGAQTETADGKPACPDVMIRYLCLDGVVDIQGNIFTTYFDRVSAKEDNDANRLQFFPKLISEDGLHMGECSLFLKEDDDVHELDLPRVKTSGSYGFIRCYANSSEPGLYNLTYNTQDNGNSMEHPRLYSHLANDDLTPFNFEVYPQVRSVHPQVGSREGGTKITIQGTGFATSFTEPDRQTMVHVGGVECRILEQSATQIICETKVTDKLIEKVDEMDNVRMDDVPFTILADGVDCAGHDIDYEIGVWSFEECIARCRRMSTCGAVTWAHELGGKCHFKHATACDSTRDLLADYPSLKSAHMDRAAFEADRDVRVTKTCYYGRGVNYIGDVNIVHDGRECVNGTKCRNTDNARGRPSCVVDDGTTQDCEILPCDRAFGNKFPGSRGLLVDFHKRQDNRPFVQKMAEKFTGLFVSDSTFIEKGSHTWLALRKNEDSYVGRERFFWTAPMEGHYRFMIAVDDWFDFTLHRENGTWELLTSDSDWSRGYENFNHRPWRQQTKTQVFAKGETVAFSMHFLEGNGGDYGVVGYQYLGVDGQGTQFDQRLSEGVYNSLDDRYQKEWQRWHFLSNEQKQQQRIYFVYQYDGVNWPNDTQVTEDRWLPNVFKLEYCNELGECRQTEDLVMHDWDKNRYQRQDWLESKIRNLFNPVCTRSLKTSDAEPNKPGHWAYVAWHDNFESSSNWPGSGWQKMEYGRMCGRMAFRLNQGTHLFYAHGGGVKNSVEDRRLRIFTPDPFKKTVPHMCMAMKGHVNYLYARVQYQRRSDGRAHDNWQWVARDGDNPHWIYESPNGGREFGYVCFNLQDTVRHWVESNNHDIDFETYDFSITEMRIWASSAYRNSADPEIKEHLGTRIVVDEITFGDYGDEGPPTMVQTKQVMTFNGKMVSDVVTAVKKSMNGLGFEEIWVEYSFIGGYCGFQFPLPKVLAPGAPEDGKYIDVFGHEEFFTDLGSVEATEIFEVTEDFFEGYSGLNRDLFELGAWKTEIRQEYTGRYLYNVNGTKMNRPRGHLHMANAYTFNARLNDNPVEGVLKIRPPVGFDTESEVTELSLDFPLSASELKSQMITAWPELGRYQFTVTRHRDNCDTGYYFDFKTTHYGNLPNFENNLELTAPVNEFVEYVNLMSEGGLYNWLIPGSALSVPSDRPEVVVTVNKMRSGCERRGEDWVGDRTCSFDFAQGATPVFTHSNVEGATVAEGQNIPIAKDDTVEFFIAIDLNKYSVDANNCEVSFSPVDEFSINGDLIQCALFDLITDVDALMVRGRCRTGSVAAGQYKLRFTHHQTGHSFSNKIYQAGYSVDTTDRAEGSELGGQRVGVSGWGFRPGFTINVFADRQCVLQEDATYESAICITTAKDQTNRKRRDNSGSTPTILSISPVKVSVLPGSLVTLTGSSYGSDHVNNRVIVTDADGNEAHLEPKSWTSGVVVFSTSMNNKGAYTVRLFSEDFGLSNEVSITVALEVHSISPEKTSIQGGNMMTIHGFGFATDEATPSKALNSDLRVEVFAGVIRCHIREVNQDNIVCEAGWGVKETNVRSTGSDFGETTIRVGESVRWEWSFTVDGAPPKVKFQQVKDSETVEAESDEDIWSDEINESTAHFTKMFTTPGTYHYTTGFIDNGFSMTVRGKLIVEDAKERAEPLQILVADPFHDRDQGQQGYGGVNKVWEHEADHVIAARRRRDTCQLTTNKAELAVGADAPADKVSMIYSWKTTPVLESIEYLTNSTRPSMEATISVGGIAVSGDCSDEVVFSIGYLNGPEYTRSHSFVKSDGQNTIDGTYKLDHEDNLDVMEDEYWFNLYIAGLGYGYYNNINNDMKINIDTVVDSMTPVKVSRGGDMVTIVGEGFTRDGQQTRVHFIQNFGPGYPQVCEITSVTYTEIVCEMEHMITEDYGDMPLRITFWEKDETDEWMIQGEQRPGQVMQRDMAAAPTINSITADRNQVTLVGTNVAGTVSMSVSETSLVNCVVNDGGATCDTPAIPAGNYYPEGKAENGYMTFLGQYLTVHQFVDAMSVSSGSFKGGQTVTLTGAGLGANTRVTVYKDGHASEAVIYSSNTETVEFGMPSVSSVGSALVVVSHSVTDDKSSFVFEYNNANIGDVTVQSSTSELQVGDTVTLTNNGVDCGQVEVEFTLKPTGCEVPCDVHAGICNADGSCSCVDGYNGDGHSCVQWLKSSKKAQSVGNDAVDYCASKSTSSSVHTYTIVMPKNQAEIDQLALLGVTDIPVGLEKSSDGSLWWTDGTPAQVTVTGDDNGNCYKFSPSTKEFSTVDCDGNLDYVVCQKVQSTGCAMDDDGMDYYGDVNIATNGKQCLDWADTISTEDELKNLDDKEKAKYGILNGNFCRNPKQMKNTVWCYTENEDGSLFESYCNAPVCAAKDQSPPAQLCHIRAANNPSVLIGKHKYVSGKRVETDSRTMYRSEGMEDWGGMPWNIQYNNGYYNIWRNVESNGKHYFWILKQNPTYGGSWGVSMNLYDDQRLKSNAHAWQLWNLDKQLNGNYRIRVGHISLWADPESEWLSGDYFTDESNPLDFEFIIDCDDGSLHNGPASSNSQVMAIADQVTCSAGSIDVAVPVLGGGIYELRVKNKQLGYTASAVEVTITTFITSIEPAVIGSGGDNKITLNGSGFSANTQVVGCIELNADGVCADENSFDCIYDSDTGGVAYTCTWGELPEGTFHVVLSQEDQSTGEVVAVTSPITVSGAMTPTVSFVEPRRGGTAGGSLVTMTGTNFGTDASLATVTIGGVNCPVQSITSTEIICETDSFRGEQVPRVPVIHIGGGAGRAKTNVITLDGEESDVTFWYIDRWSSKFTWGCTDQSFDDCDYTPKRGDIVAVSKGQVLLLDKSTPLLAVLIIDGGSLIWDHQHGIELSAEYIVVTNEGRFEVGTEERPFCHPDGRGTPMEAYITMYGHQRSIRLPIYGAKVLAVRSGWLDMHGCRVVTTWTEMDVSSEIGDTEITLTHPVKGDWHPGDQIVITSTGDIMALHHHEQRAIVSISDDGYTLTVDEPLEHTHIAVCSSGWDWADTLCHRAEVGLLTRNIKFRGNVHPQWTEDLPECERGIGTAFGTQTCFQNRFGHEVGSDQFGGHIFMHRIGHGKIEYVELTHVGQAFNLGRYPIHYHIPGNVEQKSYVRGNAIYHAFNRAVTLHAVHNLTVEYNVAYNVMGLTFFIEDGVEEDNILQYNLAVMTKKSAALLNVDAIPASFWITNANNIWRHNHVAGSTHFGYWFNAPEHPTGPSATNTICCRQKPLGQFWNNTVHSSGKYGLWVFVELNPTGPNGDCGEGTPMALKLGEIPEGEGDSTTFGLFTWNNERGAEITTGGAIQFHNFIATDNAVAGLSGKETFLNTYGLQDTQAFVRSIVIGRTMSHPELVDCGDMGIETPWEEFAFTVHDIHFFNYDQPGQYGACFAYDPCYGADAFDCGADTWFTKVRWTNSFRKIRTAWEHEYAIRDIDGSFTEQPGEEYYVVPHSPAYDTTYCRFDWPQQDGKNIVTGGRKAQLCAYENGAFKPHRFAFNAAPTAFNNLNTAMTSVHGIARSPFRICRPMGKGWMFLLAQTQVHDLSWNGMDHVMNKSYTAKAFDLEHDEYLLINHEFPQRIDYTDLGEKLESQIDPLDDSLNTLDYYISSEAEYIENRQYDLTYILKGTSDPVMSDSRGVYPSKYEVNSRGEGTHGREHGWRFKVYKCFWENCIKPTTTTQPATTTTTEPTIDCEDVNDPACVDILFEIDPLTGKNETNMYVTDKRRVTIKKVPDGVLKLTRLAVDGELDIMPEEDITIELENMIANTDLQIETRQRRSIEERYLGKIRIGTADNPVPCDKKITIKLMGNYSEAEDFGALGNTVPVGAKTIGGYGSIEMHGCPRDHYWTYMEDTVHAGANTITLDRETDWKVGEELAITTSTYEHLETEYVSIAAIAGRVITLNTTLQYRHYGIDTVLDDDGNGWNDALQLHMGSEVALLSRNIVIDGADGAGGVFGGRILVASTIEEDGGKKYHRSGYGQFSNVEFRHMGQFGYQEDLDPRVALAFYNIPTTANAATGRLQSYIKGCTFWGGFNHAIKTVRTNGLLIEDNIIMNMVNTGIVVGGTNTILRRNLIGNLHEKTSHLENIGFPPNFNAQFDGLLIADGIEAMSESTVLEDNIVAGVDGACYKLVGENCRGKTTCDSTKPGLTIKNRGHACVRGYFIFKTSASAACTQIRDFYFHHIQSDGLFSMTGATKMIVSNNVVADSANGVYVHSGNPSAEKKLFNVDKDVTIRHNVFIGRSKHFSCKWDDHNNVKFNSKTGGQRIPNMSTHNAILISDFNSGFNKFPTKPVHKVAVKPPAIYGRTCVNSNTFINYNGKCSHADTPIRTNPFVMDHTHPVYFKEGNLFVASGSRAPSGSTAKLLQTFRPKVSNVNIADCHDMHCDGMKKVLIIDEVGDFLGHIGSYIAESEYEWDGIERGGKTYSDTRDGLGDYRIPKTLLTRLNGDRIPVAEIAPEKGIIRDSTCTYEKDLLGWVCRANQGLRHFMMNYQFMDVDHMLRRITPLAIRSDTGYIDLVNGPADHSCCVGYACMIRLNAYWMTMGCDHYYDFHFTGTIPKKMNFHLPGYVSGPECKVHLNFYLAKPYRIDVQADGIYIPPTNARWVNNELEWERPRADIHLPSLNGANNAPGTNFFDRQAQSIHLIMKTGSIYSLTVKATVVLELEVMTELTEDEFYDNGNIAKNIAALLGISPSKIKMMNVVRETAQQRRKRREASGLHYVVHTRNARETDDAMTLQMAIGSGKDPEKTESTGEADDLSETQEDVEEMNQAGATLAKLSASDEDPLGSAVKSGVQEVNPEAELEVAKAAVGMAEAIKEDDDIPDWFDPENPDGAEGTIMAKLGIDDSAVQNDNADSCTADSGDGLVGDGGDQCTDENAGSIDFASLASLVAEATNGAVKLEEIETAEEKAAREQEALDAAAEPIEYTTPTRLSIQSVPDKVMIEGLAISQPIVVVMFDQNDEQMSVVGFAASPDSVTISLADGESGTLSGTTTVQFSPGSGLATFNDLVVEGSDNDVKFVVSVADTYASVPDQTSTDIAFMSASAEDTCDIGTEGGVFDVREIWSKDCANVCTSTCLDLGDLANKAPTCVERTGDCGPFAACGGDGVGCVCDLDSMPDKRQISVFDHVELHCDANGFRVTVDKCVMHKFGFTLNNLFMNGLDRDYDGPLQTSGSNTCRGRLDYQDGTHYVFAVDGLVDCGTEVTSNATHINVSNAIRGTAGENNAMITRKRNVFIDFGCSYLKEMQVSSVSVGHVESKSVTINLETEQMEMNMEMALFQTDSFVTKVTSDKEYAVPEPVYVQVDGGQLPNDMVLNMQRCWATPNTDPDNEVFYDLLDNGCVPSSAGDSVSILQTGQSSKGQLMFDSFVFTSEPTASIYLHCTVHICDPSSETCTPDCNARKRRANTAGQPASTIMVSFQAVDWSKMNSLGLTQLIGSP